MKTKVIGESSKTDLDAEKFFPIVSATITSIVATVWDPTRLCEEVEGEGGERGKGRERRQGGGKRGEGGGRQAGGERVREEEGRGGCFGLGLCMFVWEVYHVTISVPQP